MTMTMRPSAALAIPGGPKRGIHHLEPKVPLKPRVPALGPRQGVAAPVRKVEVFFIDVAGHAVVRAGLEARLAAWLTPLERERIARLRQAADRRRGLVARAALRALLAQRLGTEPAAVPIVATPAGKPMLAAAVDAEALHFSVSHSGGRVAIALGHTSLGVDIEAIAASAAWPDVAALAEAWFEPEEARRVAADPAAFLEIWTAKEAVLKAKGKGLAAHGLRGFIVPAANPEPTRVGCARPGSTPESAYVSTLAAGAGYRAALAVLDDPRPPVLCSIEAADLPAARLFS